MKKGIIAVVITIVTFLLIITLGSSIVVTQENEYTLIKQFGKVDRVIDEAGLSFKIPFVESVYTLPKEILLYDLAMYQQAGKYLFLIILAFLSAEPALYESAYLTRCIHPVGCDRIIPESAVIYHLLTCDPVQRSSGVRLCAVQHSIRYMLCSALVTEHLLCEPFGLCPFLRCHSPRFGSAFGYKAVKTVAETRTHKSALELLR